jgi:hypothetical protein
MKPESNKKVPIEETVGTGLPTLLAIKFKLVAGDLLEKGKRHASDVTSLPKIREVFGKGKITVTPKRDGTVEIKTEGGIVILTP